MRIARWLGMGLLALSTMGCGNRFASVNYNNLTNYARPAQAGMVVAQTRTVPAIDIGRPVAMAFDGANNLLVANNQDGSIMSVTSRGEALQKASNLPDPSALTVSRLGNVYVACFKDGSIVRMSNNNVRRIAKNLGGPRSVAVTSDESLYVTLPSAKQIIEIKPDGTQQTVWHDDTLVPELITVTAKDELFVSVQDEQGGRLLQISRAGKKLDEYTFENHITALSAGPDGRLLVASAAPADDEHLVGELGWLDRNGEWTILADNVARPTAIAVAPGGLPVYSRYDGSKHRYEIVSFVGDTSNPWLAAAF